MKTEKRQIDVGNRTKKVRSLPPAVLGLDHHYNTEYQDASAPSLFFNIADQPIMYGLDLIYTCNLSSLFNLRARQVTHHFHHLAAAGDQICQDGSPGSVYYLYRL